MEWKTFSSDLPETFESVGKRISMGLEINSIILGILGSVRAK